VKQDYPSRCPEPVFQSSGALYATRWGNHDWRLHKRTEKIDHEFEPQEGAPGYGNVLLQPTGVFTETWYCTKCRRVEVREVGGEEVGAEE
jgi:hypothetical protein